MNRKILPEVQQLFDKYSSQPNTRSLPRDQAVLMLQTEFSIQQWHAEEFYQHYKLDTEAGSDALSLWEFQHFYNNVGKRASEIVSNYESLDTSRMGHISDMDKLKTYLATRKTSDGQDFTEKEVTMFVKMATGGKDTEKIDLGKFSDLIARMNLYRKPKK